MNTTVKTGLAAALAAAIMIGCTDQSLVAPSDDLEPEGLRPTGISVTRTGTAVSLGWNAPAAGAYDISGYVIGRQFQDEGIDAIDTLWGTTTVTGAFDSSLAGAVADTDSVTVTVNMVIDGSGIARNHNDDFGILFETVDSTRVKYVDPIDGIKRSIYLEEGITYHVQYYVAAVSLLPQNFNGTYAEWQALPVVDRYLYRGAFVPAADYKVTVQDTTLTISD